MALEFVDLGLGREHVDYQATWDLQRAIHAEVSVGTRPDTVLLPGHPSVSTAGRRATRHAAPADPSAPPQIRCLPPTPPASTPPARGPSPRNALSMARR